MTSLYTPSTLSHELLEELFVGDQRRAVLDNITSRIRSAADSTRAVKTTLSH